MTLVYVHYKYTFGQFRWRRVPHEKGLPLVGNMLDCILQKRHIIDVMHEIYQKFPDFPYFGFYRFCTPVFVIRDLQLARQILVKDFNYFKDTDLHCTDDDILLKKNIFMMKGEKWREYREMVAPMLSSGKIRLVFPLLYKTCEDLVKHIRNAEGSSTTGLETRELSNKYTTEVIASCAFGLEANCLNNFKEDSIFREMGKKIFEPTTWTSINITLVTAVPILSKFINIRFVPELVTDWIIKMVQDTVQYRKDNKIKRDDFLQNLMQLHDQTDGQKFTMEDIAAQCTSFLLDGFETSGSVICLALYEIAKNPDVQDRMVKEIEEVLKGHEDKVTYDAMIEMTYLDAVINETLRKWPIVAAFPRTCTKDYELPPFEGGPKRAIGIKRGDSVHVAIGSFHKDPQYFSNPDKFDPSRFFEGSAETFTKDAFFPWGAGPRLCLGQRFAFLQIKTSVMAVVRSFKLKISEGKDADPKLDPRSFMPRLVGGAWITYTPR
ncbi:cytochrome P450 6k1-like [Ctenocephalides felis]|uniref:cytochrome P450 6k1-like n=1 Tax=Ctenocephalides felis TaxID=7515 RepID=UPI000E6E3995|nr:cytochrome P450 6k1-like [Ctenocephalides felis]